MTINLYDTLSNAMSNAASNAQPKEENMPGTSKLLASLTYAVEMLKEMEERRTRMNLLLNSRKDMLPMRWKLRPADYTSDESYIHIQVPSVLPDNGHKGNRSYGAVIDIPVSTLREAAIAEIEECKCSTGDTRSLAGTGKAYSHGWLIIDFSFFPGAIREKFPPFISLLLSATPAVTDERRVLFATEPSKDADLFTLNQRFFAFALAEVNYREMNGCMKYVLQGQYGSEWLDVGGCDPLSNLADTPQYTVEVSVDDDIFASFGEDLYHTDEEGSEQNGEENGDQETWSPGLDYDPHAIS